MPKEEYNSKIPKIKKIEVPRPLNGKGQENDSSEEKEASH